MSAVKRSKASSATIEFKPHSPEELRSLLSELRAELTRLYGPRLKEMLVFGSYARGEATPGSDVDVAIVLDDFAWHSDVRSEIGQFRAALCLRYDALVTLLPFREREWRARDRTIIRIVAQEGIPPEEVGRQDLSSVARRAKKDGRISRPHTRGGHGMNAQAEVNALLDRAQEALRAAGALQRDGFFRDAISRAYYAMFYTASALLLSRGESYSSHWETIGAVGRVFAKTKELDPKFHRYLLDAFEDRIDADYKVLSAPTSERVSEVIAWAEEFLEAAQSCRRQQEGSQA